MLYNTNFQDFFQIIFLDNTLGQYFILAAILLFAFIFKKYFSKLSNRIIFRLLKKYSFNIPLEKFNEHLNRPVSFFILLVFIYIAFAQIHYPQNWKIADSQHFGIKMVVEKAYIILLAISILNILVKLVDFFGLVLLKRIEENTIQASQQLIALAIDIVKIIIVILGIFIVLGSVFHLNIGSLIAGLGIGGLAVALAAKETLENLLGSFTIFFDKPFVVGDLVKTGNIVGVVEKIGFRSTRIRTLEKTFLTVPNKKMVDAELDNLSQRTQQRESFKIALSQNTTSEQLKKIVEEINVYISSLETITNDTQVSFHDINNFSFEIFIFYYLNSSDWELFLKTKENINYKILEIIKQNNAELAAPIIKS